MTAEDEIISAGRDAWSRLQTHQRTSWNDWVLIGRALLVGRRDAMLDAKANIPMGMRYNRIFSAWLRANGLDGISGQDRYKIIECLEHDVEIEAWRATLTEVQRNRWNHPNSIWLHFSRAFAPGRRVEPRPRNTTQAKTLRKNHKPIFWSQDILRAAAEGIRMANSHDIYVVARAVLDHAFPSRDALIDVLNEAPRHPSPLQGKATADADAGVHDARLT